MVVFVIPLVVAIPLVWCYSDGLWTGLPMVAVIRMLGVLSLVGVPPTVVSLPIVVVLPVAVVLPMVPVPTLAVLPMVEVSPMVDSLPLVVVTPPSLPSGFCQFRLCSLMCTYLSLLYMSQLNT